MKLSRRGLSDAGRAVPVLSGGVVILNVSREVLSPFSWVAPAFPTSLISYCHFLISLLRKTSNNILTSYLTAWAGRERGDGCKALSFLLAEAPFNCESLCFFRGPLPVSWGLSPTTPATPSPFERLTLPRTT